MIETLIAVLGTLLAMFAQALLTALTTYITTSI